jgi:hypothetical protein
MQAPALATATNVHSDDELLVSNRHQQLHEFERKLDALEQQIREQESAAEEKKQEVEEDADNNDKKCCKRCGCRVFSPKDIKTAIPGKLQSHMWMMYFLFVFNAITIFMNWIAMMVLNGSNVSSSNFAVPTAYVLLGIPGSWYFWYRRLFVAIARQSQTRFLIFNVNFIFHLIFVFVMSLGFTALSSAGLLIMLREVVSDSSTKTLFIIPTACWLMDFLFSIFLFKKCFDVHNRILYAQLMKQQNSRHSID